MTAPMLAILGAGGQVGRELAALAAARGMACRALSHAACDIADAGAVERAVSGCDLVVNCAAHTQVDRAEAEPDAAIRVNATGAGLIAAACARAGSALVQISTDYVFDGSLARPLREDDPAAPINVYGRSKWAGEQAVRAAGPRHVILRSSWIFAAHGHNFVRTILRLANERRELRIVADQIGGPTAAADLATALLRIADAMRSPGFAAWGTYHFSGAPAASWYDFARAILNGRPDVAITPIATSDYPTPARRPAYAYLDCARIQQVFGLAQPEWLPALRRVVSQASRA